MRRSTLFAIVGVFACVLVALGIGWRIWGEELAFGNERGAPTSPAAVPQTPVLERPQSADGEASDVLDEPQSRGPITTAQIAKAWEPVAEAGKEGDWTTWALVYNADTGELLFAQDEKKAHTPASVMKVLTGLYALDTLDGTQTLTTGVSKKGSDLYLWGEGDLLLTAGKGMPSSIEGRAGVLDLSDQVLDALAKEGVDSVTLLYEPTLFPGDKRNPEWEVQGTSIYAGDVAPFAINTGRVAPGAWLFVGDSAYTTATTLANYLREGGVEVDQIEPFESLPTGATRVAEVTSAPLIDQIEYMLMTSDNTMAEQLCHMATAREGIEEATFPGTSKALANYLESQGVPTEGFKAADCSGLDDRSRIKPETLTQAIKHTEGAGAETGALVRLLPIAGQSGTLATRMEEGDAYGNVAAKTGTLSVASTLTGVMTTASGENLLFAIGTDDMPESSSVYTAGSLDTFLAELAGM